MDSLRVGMERAQHFFAEENVFKLIQAGENNQRCVHSSERSDTSLFKQMIHLFSQKNEKNVSLRGAEHKSTMSEVSIFKHSPKHTGITLTACCNVTQVRHNLNPEASALNVNSSDTF